MKNKKTMILLSHLSKDVERHPLSLHRESIDVILNAYV